MPPRDTRAAARIDSYPYRHRVRDLMRSPAAYVAPDASLGAAAQRMTELEVGSLLVGVPAGHGSTAGILTERDVVRAVARLGDRALDTPVGEIASRPLATVPAEAFLYRAIGRMSRLRIRHLGVVDDSGILVGVVSARDLLRLRASEAIMLGDEIDAAEDAPALAAAWAKLPAVARSLIAEDVAAPTVAALISEELGAATRQAAVVAERALAAEGHGSPPAPYAVLVLGSAGRGESLLAADQDNAVVHADTPDQAAAGWFARFGERLSAELDAAGIPLCKGGVMAGNEAWRADVSGWRRRIDGWIRRSRPADLLNVDIFFDLRCVHGDASLAEEIRAYAFEQGHANPAFAKLLAEATEGYSPPIGLFGRIRTEDGRVDLKRGGLFPIVAAARVLAIRHDVRERSTPARLRALMALGIGAGQDLESFIGIHQRLLRLVLRQQVDDLEVGLPPSNAVRLKALPAAEQEELRDALSGLTHLDSLVRDLLF